MTAVVRMGKEMNIKFPIVMCVDDKVTVDKESEFGIISYVKGEYLYVKEKITTSRNHSAPILTGWILQYDGVLLDFEFVCTKNEWLRPLQPLFNPVYNKYALHNKGVARVCDVIERLNSVKRKRKMDKDFHRYLSTLNGEQLVTKEVLDLWPI